MNVCVFRSFPAFIVEQAGGASYKLLDDSAKPGARHSFVLVETTTEEQTLHYGPVVVGEAMGESEPVSGFNRGIEALTGCATSRQAPFWSGLSRR